MRRRVWVAKHSPTTTAGEFQKIVESQGQKTLKEIVKQHPHVVWEGFKKKSPSSSKKINSSIFSHQTRLELQMGLASMVRWNKKNENKKIFLAAKTQDGFGEHRDKKYSTCTMKYTAVFLMLWAYISAGGPGHLV